MKKLKASRLAALMLILVLLCGLTAAARADVATLGIYFCGKRVAEDGTETIVLRSAPSGSCSTVGILRTGEKVRLLGHFGGFRYVRSPAGAGFLSSEEIK